MMRIIAMTPNQKKSLILASIIGTLFATYDKKEQTRLHKEIHVRIGKGIRKQVDIHSKEEVIFVAHVQGNGIWKQAVDHFAERKITIEASSTVLALVNLDEKALSKHYGLGAGILAKWAKPCRRSDALELEKAGNEVAKYVFNAVNELYDIEVEEKMSVLERIAQARR
ncbi:hypothetical protein PF327_11255 [Sulfurovum sp. XTW-4]|uniref:Uncharacterized protein n=1 Tax=Sulfurovum xiamenensis TaxID=3019066 RepID=A0ABT7QVH5_9BACT|nr:hypothetical protein [Sulfurovum xiamenensis]MDM5264772.1 hypothetical protein [Sulfurovum xiamenensis]